MIEFVLGVIVTTIIVTLFWSFTGVIYLKSKVNAITDELKDKQHADSNFHRDVYDTIDEVEGRFHRKFMEIENKLTELDGKEPK
jgi:hypothetical protein